MKVYINGRFYSQSVTGVQRYAREMTAALDGILAEEESADTFELLLPKNALEVPQFAHIPARVCGSHTGYFWEQLELPRIVKDGFLLNFCNCAPLFKTNQLVTIHDAAFAAFPEGYTFAFRTWYRFMCTVLGKRLAHILTVSHFSAEELHKHCGIPLEKFLVTYNGTDHLDRIVPDEGILQKAGVAGGDYVLAVSSLSPRKNFRLVLQAAKRLPEVRFLIAGGTNPRVFADDLDKDVQNVSFIGYVTDEELKALYQHAAVFVYPSIYEGFGIPPFEAMVNRCPAIVAETSSLPEVCGEAVLYCGTEDAAGLAEQIHRVMTDAALQSELVEKGERRVKDFQWTQEARKLYALLKQQRKGADAR